MPHFTVGIRGADLDVAALGPPLEAAGINVSESQFAEGEASEGVVRVLAHVAATDADEARALVMDALPDGDRTLEDPVQTD